MTLTRWCKAAVPVVLALTACSDPDGPGSRSEPIDALPRQLSVSEQKVIAGSNAFAFDLLKAVNASDRAGNVFISPLSASMALGMTMNGAAGSTFDAMRSTLRFGDLSRTEINESYKSLISLLRGLDNSTQFAIANSIWYEETWPFRQEFMTESKSYFDAQVKGLDLSKPSSADVINAWVSDATSKKIPKIIDDFDGDEVMFLINAIYFKGQWESQFKKSNTADAPFHALDGSTQNVPMMGQTGAFRRSFGTDYDAFDLPYGNTAFTMTVVIPKQSDINAFTESLTEAKWKAIDAAMTKSEIVVGLPKFKLEWKKNLNDQLKALGMSVAYDDNSADFSRMSASSQRLVISDVIQKTYVDINEEGTEAAAATSVGAVPTSMPPLIRADRPFVFAIRERLSGTIMFIGKITKLPI
jgi:serpin B